MNNSSDASPGNLSITLLASSRAISVLGNGFGRVALAFAVLRLPHGSPQLLSAVLACQAVPQLVLVLFGGVIGDKFPRMTVMILAELLGAAAWSALFAGFLTNSFPSLAYCALACCAGVATAILSPALNGAVADLSTAENFQRSNSFVRASQNTATVIGLALAGVSVTLIGTAWTVGLNAGSFIVSAGFLSLIRIPTSPPRKRESFLAALRTGWVEFSSRRWLWAVVTQFAFVLAALNAFVGVLGPLEAQDHLGGARAWSVLAAAQALGAVLGAGLASRLHPARPLRLGVGAVFLLAVPMLAVAAMAPIWISAVLMFVAGVAVDIFGVLWATTLQHEVDRSALSRVSSYDLFGSLTLAPLALLVAGPAGTAFGLGYTVIGCAVIIMLATMITLSVKSVRTLQAKVRSQPESSAVLGGYPGKVTGLPPLCKRVLLIARN
jgi:MFS family permease